MTGSLPGVSDPSLELIETARQNIVVDVDAPCPRDDTHPFQPFDQLRSLHLGPEWKPALLAATSSSGTTLAVGENFAAFFSSDGSSQERFETDFVGQMMAMTDFGQDFVVVFSELGVDTRMWLVGRSGASELAPPPQIAGQITFVTAVAQKSPGTLLMSGRFLGDGSRDFIPFWATCNLDSGQMDCPVFARGTLDQGDLLGSALVLVPGADGNIALGESGQTYIVSNEGPEKITRVDAAAVPANTLPPRLLRLGSDILFGAVLDRRSSVFHGRFENGILTAGVPISGWEPEDFRGAYRHDGETWAVGTTRMARLDPRMDSVLETVSVGSLFPGVNQIRRFDQSSDGTVRIVTWSGQLFMGPPSNVRLAYGPEGTVPNGPAGILEPGVVLWADPISSQRPETAPVPVNFPAPSTPILRDADSAMGVTVVVGEAAGKGMIWARVEDTWESVPIDESIGPLRGVAVSTTGKFAAFSTDWSLVSGDINGAKLVTTTWDDPTSPEIEAMPEVSTECGVLGLESFAAIDASQRMATVVGCYGVVVRVDLELGRAQRVAVPEDLIAADDRISAPAANLSVVRNLSDVHYFFGGPIKRNARPSLARLVSAELQGGWKMKALDEISLVSPAGAETRTPMALVGPADNLHLVTVMAANEPVPGAVDQIPQPDSGVRVSLRIPLPVRKVRTLEDGRTFFATDHGRVFVGE